MSFLTKRDVTIKTAHKPKTLPPAKPSRDFEGIAPAPQAPKGDWDDEPMASLPEGDRADKPVAPGTRNF
jgi:hypothetical protein